jgi:hypothetical protein
MKDYSKLKTKYKLPEYKELDNNFQITTIEETSDLLRDIIKKIEDKIERYLKILEEIIQPDSQISAMHEGSFFDNEEKEKIFSLYKKIMIIKRDIDQTELEATEEEKANLIKNINEEWEQIKKKLKPILEKLKNTWKKEIKSTVKEEYLG